MVKALPPLRLRPILARAFSAARSQPVLTPVAFWLIAVPGFLLSILDRMMPGPGAATEFPKLGTSPLALPFAVTVGLILILVLFWGYTSVLLVGRRLVVQKQGRGRTSFRAVRRESRSLLVPIIFTNILREIFVLYRSLLYIVPAFFFALGTQACREPLFLSWYTVRSCSLLFILLPLLLPAILYFVRTCCADSIVIAEELAPREALLRSKALVSGRTGTVLAYLVVFYALFVFLPATVGSFLEGLLTPLDWRLFFLTDALTSILMAAGLVLLTFSQLLLYGALRGLSKTSHTFVEA